MRLSMDVVNAHLDRLAASLDGGTVEFCAGRPPDAVEDDIDGQRVLARVHLPSPAFAPAVNARALSLELPPAVIQATGTARWGRFVTASGVTVGDFLARAATDPDASSADALLERTDFQRGGTLTVPLIMLRLPQSS